MVFADPHACPNCAGRISGEPRCTHCDFDLDSSIARTIWLKLQEVDALLDSARRAPPAASQPISPPIPPLAPSLPRPPVSPVPARRVSAGSIVLAVGALCLIVAGLVFVTVSWAVLGPAARTSALLVVTIAVAAGAQLLTHKSLRASAEALWAVFLGLWAIDFFAGRAYGIAALDRLDGSTATFVFGALTMVIGATITRANRATTPLVVPTVAAGASVWVAGFAFAAVVDAGFFWSALAALAITAVGAAGLWLCRLRLAVWVAAPAVALTYGAAVVGAVVELVDSPHLDQLVGAGHGVPMVVMIALTIGCGVAVAQARIPAAALAVVGAASLLITPAAAAQPQTGGIAVAAAISVVGAVALCFGSGRWQQGARVGIAAVTLGLASVSLGWFANAVQAIDAANGMDFGSSWVVRLSNGPDLPGSGWLALVAFAALSGSVAAAMRWPEIATNVRRSASLPVAIAGTGIVLAVIAFEPTVLVAAGTTLAVAVVTAFMVRAQHDTWLTFVLLVTTAPTVMTLASRPVSLLIWLAVAAVLGAYAWQWGTIWARRTAAFGAAVLVLAGTTLAGAMRSFEDQELRLVVIVVALFLLLAAEWAWRSSAVRLPIEMAAGLGLAVVLLSAIDTGPAPQAFLWTVTGVPLVLLGLVLPDRRWARQLGALVLGVAWVLRLLASDVDVIEAYTAPFAAVLLAAGLWAMRADVHLRSWRALTPGLTLALLPSMPQALEDPTGLRALLLGVAALIVLAVGVRLAWQLPFLFGATVVGLLVLWNIGPPANGLPRWLLIGIVGVGLVGLGISWESRIRSAKSAIKYVADLR